MEKVDTFLAGTEIYCPICGFKCKDIDSRTLIKCSHIIGTLCMGDFKVLWFIVRK